jgi:hypothetical protein
MIHPKINQADNSVASRAVGRPVEIQAYAERIVIRQDGVVVGEHRRCFGRDQTIYKPWHYVPVLTRKPGALRPSRTGIAGQSGARASPTEGLGRRRSPDGQNPCRGADRRPGRRRGSCAEALAGGVHSADVVLNILARHRDPGPVATILAPEALRLRQAPIADCARCDRLRKAG